MISNILELEQDVFVDLFELTGYNPDSPGDVYRFCNFQGVTFGGIKYYTLPCQIDGIEITSEGTQPEPTITISDEGGLISDLIALYDIGGRADTEIRIKRTQKRYLDIGSTPDPTAIIAEANFFVVRKENHAPREFITFILANPIDIDGVQLPRRHALRTCTAIYRGEGCPYVGSTMWDLSGNPTNDSTKDRCGKSVSDCKLRFGENSPLPFLGFPSLARRN